MTTREDIDRLRVPDPETTFPLNEVLKATRIIVRETAGRVFINGRADQGPIALALALCGPARHGHVCLARFPLPAMRRR